MVSEQSIPITIPAADLHAETDAMIRRVLDDQEHLIVEKDGQPVVAMIPIPEYHALMRERAVREERLRQFEAAARAIGEEAERLGYTEEQMMEELKETRRKLFKEKYGDPGKSTSHPGDG